MISKITTPLFEFIEKLSKIQRIALCSGLFVLVAGGFGWLSIYPKFSDIQRLKTEVEDLERKLTIAKRKAGQRERYRKMLENAKVDFNIARKALPEKKEIPSLLTGISRAGKTAGLEFYLFDPRSEKERDFYAEIPVDIKVKGSYHNVAGFFDKVSRLFRVVNITDIVITKGKQSDMLDTSCKAITYRFLEKAAGEKPKAKK
jgi:type IV pilus assembly protein PilO